MARDEIEEEFVEWAKAHSFSARHSLQQSGIDPLYFFRAGAVWALRRAEKMCRDGCDGPEEARYDAILDEIERHPGGFPPPACSLGAHLSYVKNCILDEAATAIAKLLPAPDGKGG